MALSLRCPKCDATLRIDQTLEPGQEVGCPRCGFNFLPPPKDDVGPSTSSRSREDGRPARPKARPRRQDDDNRSQKRTVARSRRGDDEEEDRRSGKQKSNSGTVIALVVGVVLFLFVGFGGIVTAVVYVLNNHKDVAADGPAANNPAPPAPVPINTGKPGETSATSGSEWVWGTGSPAGTASPTGTGTTSPAPASTSDLVQPIAPAPGKGEMPPEVEAKIRKATVYVEVSLGNQGACGSGFIVRSSDDTAYVVTNNHVIAADMDDNDKEPAGPPGRPGMGRPPGVPVIIRPPRIGPIGPPNRRPEPKREKVEISVMLYRGTPQQMVLEATVVATDPDADLAVLRISGGRNYPAPIDLATEADLVEFSPVRIFGYPNGRKELVISRAVASQLVRNSHGELTDVQLNINSAEVTHGNSGGPVVDVTGRLVGVTVAGINEKNLGWAIPTTKLAHMFRGSVNGGLLYQLRQKGNGVGVSGESWRLDRQNRVESRNALDVIIDPNAPNQVFPPNEYHAIALLSDPLKKIRSVQVLYVVKKSDSVVRDGTGWGPLRNAQTVDMTLSERSAQVVLKLTDGSAEDAYAVQFAYVDGEGKTKYTEPHEVRFTFPKSLNTASIIIVGIKDDATKRYISESLRSCIGSGNITTVNTPDGVKATVEPVEDPKALADRITFGKATVAGWQITVVVGKVELPRPREDEVNKALADLNTKQKQVRIAAADRLAKCYTTLPERRVEVAKALVAMVVEKDFWASRAAMNALKIWGCPEVVKDLAAVLEAAEENQPQGDLIGLIAPYKDPTSAKALAKRLSSGFDRGPAAAALKAIGPAAEKAVFPVLEGKESWTVREACLVLKEIGTKDAIAPLQALIDRKPDFVIAPTANEALAAVKARSAKPAGPSIAATPSTPSTPVPSSPSPSTPAPSTPASPSKPGAAAPDQEGKSLSGWGLAIDPMKDCEFTPEKDRLTMKIVGSGHQKLVERINLNAPRVMREVEGDFTVTVKVAGEFSPVGPSTNPKSVPWQGAGIIVWNDMDNYIRLERAASKRGMRVAPYINFEEFKAGAHGVTNNDGGKEGDCWLRMERKGNTILGSVSFDGSTWKELKPMEVEWPAKLKIGLQATTTSSQLPWSVSFEDYELKAAKAKKVD